jgi:hypothetical protein
LRRKKTESLFDWLLKLIACILQEMRHIA